MQTLIHMQKQRADRRFREEWIYLMVSTEAVDNNGRLTNRQDCQTDVLSDIRLSIDI